MMEKLFGHKSNPLIDLPFVMGGGAFRVSSSSPTGSIPVDAQTIHEEDIIVEINVEMEAAAQDSGIRGGMVGPGLAPL